MELNVCGAIPPYNEILGGKLVALLATSPQVIHDYKERYESKPSEIASRLKGCLLYTSLRQIQAHLQEKTSFCVR